MQIYASTGTNLRGIQLRFNWCKKFVHEKLAQDSM